MTLQLLAAQLVQDTGMQLAKACYYAIARWEGLKRFLEDGRLPLDNMASERASARCARLP
jgi:hypothetical protein